jgi:hypothetical protein
MAVSDEISLREDKETRKANGDRPSCSSVTNSLLHSCIPFVAHEFLFLTLPRGLYARQFLVNQPCEGLERLRP